MSHRELRDHCAQIAHDFSSLNSNTEQCSVLARAIEMHILSISLPECKPFGFIDSRRALSVEPFSASAVRVSINPLTEHDIAMYLEPQYGLPIQQPEACFSLPKLPALKTDRRLSFELWAMWEMRLSAYRVEDHYQSPLTQYAYFGWEQVQKECDQLRRELEIETGMRMNLEKQLRVLQDEMSLSATSTGY